MNFIMEWGFDALKGKSRELQEWLQENEERFGKEAPPGWEYVGTYAVVMSTEKEAGNFRQLWRMDSYGAQDAFAAAMREGGPFAQLVDEMSKKFVDQERDAHWSQQIYRSVVDASIWGE